jgi:hypothetical protein
MPRVSGSLYFGFNLLTEIVIFVTQCYGYDIILQWNPVSV